MPESKYEFDLRLLSSLSRAIDVVDDTYNVMLLVLFLHFGVFFAFYGFLILSVSAENFL